MQPQREHFADDGPRKSLSELTQHERIENITSHNLSWACARGIPLVNVRRGVECKPRRASYYGTILISFVVVLFYTNFYFVEAVRWNSSYRNLLISTDMGGQQLTVLHRRNLQSTPVAAPTSELWSIHLNAGASEDYTDGNGTTWISDSYFGGKGQRYVPTNCEASIAFTSDGNVYCTQRSFSSAQSSPPFIYRVPVPKVALYEIRLHFAEIFFSAVGDRVFDILIENSLVTKNLDVFEQVGAFAPYVVSFQKTISDGSATIRLREVVQNPFISAIEVFEVESNATSVVSPTLSPASAATGLEVRVNAGGPRYNDSLGNVWVGDKFFKGKGAISSVNCPGNVSNTMDSALFCTQRYFRSTDELPFAYNVPVNKTSQYLVRLYFAEMNFTATGERVFDVLIEGELAINNLDIFSAAGGWSTAYVASFVTTVSDGNATIEFVPVVENPTISAVEVIQINGNGTVIQPLVPSPSPIAPGSASPTFDVDGFSVAECSAYATCVDANFTGLCCPMANGESRECCAASLVPSELPSSSPVFVSNQPSNVPTFQKLSSTPTASPITSAAPSISPSANMPSTSPTGRSFEYNETRIAVRNVIMVLGYKSQVATQTESLPSNCTLSWQESIKDRIASEVVSVIQRYETMSVKLQNVSRASNFTSLSLTFDVVITIRSALQDLDAKRYIKGPFDTRSDKSSYIQFLESLGCSEFENIGTLEISVPLSNATATENDSPNDDDSMLWIIIAGSVGGAILLTVVATFCCRGTNRRKINDVAAQPLPVGPSSRKEKLTTFTPSEIDNDDGFTDISTLGDPIITSAGTNARSDDVSTVGSTSMEYDFNRAFVDVESVVSESHKGGSTIGGSTFRQSVVTPDDLLTVNDIVSAYSGDIQSSVFTPEVEVRIVAPPGVLGLILETSTSDGRPMVNSIKPSSCLTDLVLVGDRLISVDDENVSGMTASNVSRLIASRLDKSRVLVLKRRILDTSSGAC